MTRIVHNRAEQEFVMTVDGAAAVLAYQRDGDVYSLTHTGVPPALEGQGIGSRLVRGGLDQIRDAGGRVIALCPFVKAWIDRHPEYRDLLT